MVKILLVEDNPQLRSYLRDELQKHFPGYLIQEASTGREALDLCRTLNPDLVFMDINLPDQSGLPLTRQIKTEYPNCRVVLLTSYDLPEYRQAALESGASRFLVKGSCEKKEILDAVRSLAAG